MRFRSRKRKRTVGFTLLEALTVLAIMGILSSLAVLVYTNQRRAVRARSAARQIEVLFTTARSLAINQNTHFQAVLDLNSEGLWIDQVDAEGRVVAPKLTTPETWPAYVDVIGAEVNGQTTRSGLVRIRFHPNGTSDSARIVLMSGKNDNMGSEEYMTVKMYGSTARSRTFAGARL
jgi:prepilin-type N-terminal cleavage/methylation domain-containing protein